MEIFDPTISNLESGLDRTNRVQEVISQNLANAQNPDYIPKRFDEVLNKAVEKQNKKGVVMEEEMADMAKNTGEHGAYLKMLNSKFAILRSIVTLGRK